MERGELERSSQAVTINSSPLFVTIAAVKKQLFILLLMVFAVAVFAQRKPIRLYKTLGNVRFEYDTLIISSQQVKQLLLQEPDAYEEFRKARVSSSISSALGAAGGAVIAFALVNSILNKEADLNTALVGGLLVAASLPFEHGYRVRTIKAIDLYNQKASTRLSPEPFWRGTSAGLRLRF